MIRHTVLVMTYKQEEYIADCLDSILSQSEMPYQVVVCDDRSPDGTWSIVQQYAEQYPTVVKAYQNDHNLGVFGNYNQLMRRATGDLVNIVSGDDMLPAGILERYSQFIEEHGLDCTTPFTIYTNSEVLLPDGSSVIKSNYVNRHIDPLELTLLCSFIVWDTGLSGALVHQMPDIRSDVGYQADWLQHAQRVLCCQGQHYFMDTVGYRYRQSVGVTVAEKFALQVQSKLDMMAIFERDFPQVVTPRVARYFAFERAYFRDLLEPSVANDLRYLWQRLCGGRFPKNNAYRENWRTAIPQYARQTVKKLLCLKKRSS